MGRINKIYEKRINGILVKLFEFDVNNVEDMNELKEYLVNKVKISKVHNVCEYDLNYYGAKNMNPMFIAKFNEQVSRVCVPKRSKTPQFDVRRERVTEWMAQYLLEKEYGCTFFDEADKRINLQPVEIDKHTDGIDVPGILFDEDGIKFVVCEVKASEAAVPCSSADGLKNDIQKAIDNIDNRLSREILQYIYGLRNVKMQDDIFIKIFDFLTRLITDDNNMKKGIVFFPILLRNNKDIAVNNDMRDFDRFVLRDVEKENVEGAIMSFEKKFDDFSNDIYKEAIGE